MSKKRHGGRRGGKKGSALGNNQPGPAQRQPQKQAERSEFLSAEVSSKERAGRAPYNFVPLPGEIRWWSEDDAKIPTHDRYHDDLLSGVIELKLEALTDFYVRGMWRLSEYEEGKEIKDQELPFLVNGQLRLPGSTLRGMTRTLVEILSAAPLDPINADQHLVFRAVGASDNSQHKSYDANAKTYKERIWTGKGTEAEPAYPTVQVGYLTAKGAEWKITPAQTGAYRSQWYRVDFRNDIPRELPPPPPRKIWFLPAECKPGQYPHSRVWYRFGKVDRANMKLQEDIAHCPGGYSDGYLVESGKIQRKYLQWIVHAKDNSAAPVRVPEFDVDCYLEDAKNARGRKFRRGQTDEPCFYVEWTDNEGRRHISFGSTPYFRLPYVRTPGEANLRARASDAKRWDMAQAIFGRVSKSSDDSRKGRVTFEDAFCVEGDEYDEHRTETVLGAPKPTTYQHYLVQKSDTHGEAIHWDGDGAKLRGHKRYWHRNGVEIPRAAAKQSKVSTSFKKAKTGASFVARVRYENLYPEELGALLTALDLPQGCAHQLGMGKAIGLGSFGAGMTLTEIERQDRYRRLLDDSGALTSGVSKSANATRLQNLKDKFAAWVLKSKEPTDAAVRLWETERLKELLALLTFDPPRNCQGRRWYQATRHLEFGQLPAARGERRGKNFNEYTHTYEETSDHQNVVDSPNPRRPLPPASQVRDAHNIPTDRIPDKPLQRNDDYQHRRRR
jgi:CRISPR-associated protein (TIGR03986 family)